MKIFFYLVCDKIGNKKIGFLKGQSKNEVENSLRKKGYLIIKIKKIIFIQSEISKAELKDFFMKLKVFVKNGYQFYKIIEIFQGNEKLDFYIERMKKSINEGRNLHSIFEESGLPLKEVDIFILRAGEETGKLYNSFEGIEERISQEIEKQKRIRKILFYPILVLLIVIVLLIFLGKFILPDFVNIIGKDRIPIFTRVIIFLANNIIYVFLFLIIFFIGIKKLYKNKRERIIEFFLKNKILSKIIIGNFILYFSKILVILLESGISLSDAISIIIDSINNDFFRKKLLMAKNHLIKGKDIFYSLESMDIFDKVELEFIKTGEQSGELSSMFQLIYERKKEVLDEKIDRFIKLLEPTLILIIGIIVGGIFLGIYGPILEMMNNI